MLAVNKLNDMSRLFLSRPMPDVISGQDVLPILIGQVALIVGFVAYFMVYAQGGGRLVKNALRLFCGGGILLAVGHVSFMPGVPDGLFVLVLLGVAAALIGLILSGIWDLGAVPE